MATNKKLLLERMESKSKYTNAQKWGWAQTLAILIVVAFVAGFVLLLNALIPPGW